MPNWCYNGLTIEGNPDEVKKLIQQMNTPYSMIHDNWNMDTKQMEVKQTTYPNPVFAFHNIWNHRQEGIDDLEYVKQRDHSLPIDEAMKFQGNTWYDWNVRNWGTKWDVAVSADDKYPDTYLEEATNGENHVAYYNFNTAWAPPVAAIARLSIQYPSLLFTLSYEEETGWGGEMELLRGEVISESEYSNQCRDCDETDCMEYCDNDCGEICSSCNWLGEADLEAVAQCDTHKVFLETNVPEYRKVQS